MIHQTDHNRRVSRRDAQINRTSDGNTLGIAIFLNKYELRELGINLNNTDRVIYTVEDGAISLTKPQRIVEVDD